VFGVYKNYHHEDTKDTKKENVVSLMVNKIVARQYAENNPQNQPGSNAPALCDAGVSLPTVKKKAPSPAGEGWGEEHKK
jgi:hypothetical protein